jgi:hypothetical protein
MITSHLNDSNGSAKTKIENGSDFRSLNANRVAARRGGEEKKEKK